MTEIVETIEREGLTGNIFYSEDAESPLEFEELIHLFVTWSGYKLGHEEMPEYFFEILDHFDINHECVHCGKEIDFDDEIWFHAEDWKDVRSSGEPQFCYGKAILPNTDDLVIVPLYVYEHGRITMNTGGFSCGWDSGQAGVAVTKKSLWDWKDADPEKGIEEFIKYYARYLEGEVFGYQILDESGQEIDSRWGIIGSEYVEEEVNRALDFFTSPDERVALKEKCITQLALRAAECRVEMATLRREILAIRRSQL